MKKLIFASLVGVFALTAAPLPGPQATSSTKTTKKNMKKHKSKKAAKSTPAK